MALMMIYYWYEVKNTLNKFTYFFGGEEKRFARKNYTVCYMKKTVILQKFGKIGRAHV